MKTIIDLIRVKHWVKNILVFLPLICSGLLNTNNLITCTIGVISFSFMTSFVYIINDIKDIEKDRKHPRKKNRPLANGKISKKSALIIGIFLLIISIVLNVLITKNLTNASIYLLLIYMIINILYSIGLKNIAILDIFLLASGFIIRVYYGASIINVTVSNWLFLTILNSSLFLGLGKRKKELICKKEVRKVLEEYNEYFLDKFQYLTLTLTIVFYSLWTMEQNNKYLVFTIPIIILIFMKYCLIVEKSDEGDPTTILYQDKFLLTICLVYGLLMILFLV